MSRLAGLSLANRGLVALIAIIVTAFGLLRIPKLRQQLFPSLDFPAAFILASYPGAEPEIVEREVTEPIENSISGIEGIQKVTSTTFPWSSWPRAHRATRASSPTGSTRPSSPRSGLSTGYARRR
jgi:multidrug efflux pump subunit AcrB